MYNIQWRYSIRLENLQKQRVQLRERHWRIFSSSGTLETAKGRGVIGQVSDDYLEYHINCILFRSRYYQQGNRHSNIVAMCPSMPQAAICGKVVFFK